MMTKDVQRDIRIDVMRGIAIVLMVLGHCSFPFTDFIYLFHMSFFFLVSGYCYKTWYSDSVKNVGKFIWSKIKNLWFPYVLWNAIFVLLNNFFIKINVYTDNPELLGAVDGTYIALHHRMSMKEMVVNIVKSFFFGGGTTMGGAFWFLESLFMVSVAYVICDFIIKRISKKREIQLILQAVVSMVLLFLGYFCYLIEFKTLGIDRMLSYYWLFFAGMLFKELELPQKLMSAYRGLKVAGCFAGIVICGMLGVVYLDNNNYTNPLFFIAVSVMGWFLIEALADALIHFKLVTKMWCVLGQNTLAIVVLHFLCFKIVNGIGVLIKGEPAYLIAAFPVLYKEGAWWILYTVMGVAIPTLLNEWRKMAFQTMEKRRRI